MRTDIVIRLRQKYGGQLPICAEAADEIERLRAEINSMASAQAGWGRVARLEAEIERLRKLVDEWERTVQLAEKALWGPNS